VKPIRSVYSGEVEVALVAGTDNLKMEKRASGREIKRKNGVQSY
jgi:hypothetical protein